LFISLHVYGGLAAPLAVIAVLLLAAALGLYYALAAAGAWHWGRAGPLAAASVWNSTATRVRASGWHRGMSSLVFLAAMMAATRAMPRTSPFLALPLSISARVAGNIWCS
jgi:hypothetical protein